MSLYIHSPAHAFSYFCQGSTLHFLLFPTRNPLSFSISCSFSDSPLSQGAPFCHLDSLPLHNLVIWMDGSVSSPFGKGGSSTLANCSLCGTEATLSYSASSVCSASSLLVSAAPTSLPLLFSDSYFTFLSSFLLSILHSLAGSIFSFLLYY